MPQTNKINKEEEDEEKQTNLEDYKHRRMYYPGFYKTTHKFPCSLQNRGRIKDKRK